MGGEGALGDVAPSWSLQLVLYPHLMPRWGPPKETLGTEQGHKGKLRKPFHSIQLLKN